MAGNALQIRVAVNEMLEDLVLLLIAGLQGHAVLPVAFGMILVVLPQVVRLNAEQHIDIGQALGAVVAGLLPAPERGAEVASKLTVRPFSLAARRQRRMKSAQFLFSAGVMPDRCSQSKPSNSSSRSTFVRSYSVRALCIRS